MTTSDKKQRARALETIRLDVIDELNELEHLLRIVPELRCLTRYMDDVFDPRSFRSSDRIKGAAEKVGITDEQWQRMHDDQASMPGDEDTGNLGTMLDAIIAAIRLRLLRTVRLIELVE